MRFGRDERKRDANLSKHGRVDFPHAVAAIGSAGPAPRPLEYVGQSGTTAILLTHSSASDAIQISNSSSIVTTVAVFWETIKTPGLVFLTTKSAK